MCPVVMLFSHSVWGCEWLRPTFPVFWGQPPPYSAQHNESRDGKRDLSRSSRCWTGLRGRKRWVKLKNKCFNFFSLDHYCNGTTKTTITIEDGDNFHFRTQGLEEEFYKGKTKCSVEYELGETCTEMTFDCREQFSLKGGKNCKKNTRDKLTIITADGETT